MTVDLRARNRHVGEPAAAPALMPEHLLLWQVLEAAASTATPSVIFRFPLQDAGTQPTFVVTPAAMDLRATQYEQRLSTWEGGAITVLGAMDTYLTLHDAVLPQAALDLLMTDVRGVTVGICAAHGSALLIARCHCTNIDGWAPIDAHHVHFGKADFILRQPRLGGDQLMQVADVNRFAAEMLVGAQTQLPAAVTAAPRRLTLPSHDLDMVPASAE